MDPTFTQVSVIDKIEVLEGGEIQVRRADRIYKDGVEVSTTYQRFVLHPGDDLTDQEPRVKAVAKAVWPKAKKMLPKGPTPSTEE